MYSFIAFIALNALALALALRVGALVPSLRRLHKVHIFLASCQLLMASHKLMPFPENEQLRPIPLEIT